MVKSYLLIKNVDNVPLTLNLIDGKNVFKYQYRSAPQVSKPLSFYGAATRLWVE